jgi:hypothetical protein
LNQIGAEDEVDFVSFAVDQFGVDETAFGPVSGFKNKRGVFAGSVSFWNEVLVLLSEMKKVADDFVLFKNDIFSRNKFCSVDSVDRLHLCSAEKPARDFSLQLLRATLLVGLLIKSKSSLASSGQRALFGGVPQIQKPFVGLFVREVLDWGHFDFFGPLCDFVSGSRSGEKVCAGVVLLMKEHNVDKLPCKVLDVLVESLAEVVEHFLLVGAHLAVFGDVFERFALRPDELWTIRHNSVLKHFFGLFKLKLVFALFVVDIFVVLLNSGSKPVWVAVWGQKSAREAFLAILVGRLDFRVERGGFRFGQTHFCS